MSYNVLLKLFMTIQPRLTVNDSWTVQRAAFWQFGPESVKYWSIFVQIGQLRSQIGF